MNESIIVFLIMTAFIALLSGSIILGMIGSAIIFWLSDKKP